MAQRTIFSLFLFFLFTLPALAKINLVDGYFRFWKPDLTGQVGDTILGAVDSQSDPTYSLGFRLENKKSITDLLYTRFNLVSPFVSSPTLSGYTYPTGPSSQADFDAYLIDLHLKNEIWHQPKLSLRFVYGTSYLDARESLRDLGGKVGLIDVRGMNLVFGLEGEFYLSRILSLRSHYKFGDRGLGPDKIEIQDFEVGLQYVPMSMMQFQLGYKKSDFDLKDDRGRTAGPRIDHSLRGPFAQVNWMF